MAVVGYARVSSVGQKLEVQFDKLNKYGCNKTYSDKLSGANNARPNLQAALDYVREGDTFVISRIDRLARSVSHLAGIVDALRDKGVDLVVIDQNIETKSAAGRMMLHMLGVFAAFEREIAAERRADGIARAKREDAEKGVNRFGRPKVQTPELLDTVQTLRKQKISMSVIEQRTGVSRATLYRMLRV